MHPTLRRQLKRFGISDTDGIPTAEQWTPLLAAISETYTAYDSDRYTLERSLDISSREMQDLYADLEKSSRSQLAQERDRLRAIISNIGDGVLILDTEGRMVELNAAGRTILGYEGDTFVGTPLHRHLTAESVAELTAFAARTDGDNTLRKDRLNLRCVSGLEIPISYVMTKLRHEGELRGLVMSFRDITEQLNAIRILQEAREAAERASRAKSEFLSSMSHELRTPMHAVLGFAQLLEFEELNEEQHEHVQEILKAGGHLLELINRVLDLAKIESGRLDLTLTPVALGPVIDECASMARNFPARRDISLGFPEDVDSIVIADRTRLKQCLLNLLSNAIKYNRDAGQVELVVTQGEPGRIQISVADTGAGIAPDQLDEVFQAFNRLNADKTNVEGTGIGLTITRQLVELMGGSIEVCSEQGIGSTFTIDLAAHH